MWLLACCSILLQEVIVGRPRDKSLDKLLGLCDIPTLCRLRLTCHAMCKAASLHIHRANIRVWPGVNTTNPVSLKGLPCVQQIRFYWYPREPGERFPLHLLPTDLRKLVDYLGVGRRSDFEQQSLPFDAFPNLSSLEVEGVLTAGEIGQVGKGCTALESLDMHVADPAKCIQAINFLAQLTSLRLNLDSSIGPVLSEGLHGIPRLQSAHFTGFWSQTMLASLVDLQCLTHLTWHGTWPLFEIGRNPLTSMTTLRSLDVRR